jgi:hypothetical protein
LFYTGAAGLFYTGAAGLPFNDVAVIPPGESRPLRKRGKEFAPSMIPKKTPLLTYGYDPISQIVSRKIAAISIPLNWSNASIAIRITIKKDE